MRRIVIKNFQIIIFLRHRPHHYIVIAWWLVSVLDIILYLTTGETTKDIISTLQVPVIISNAHLINNHIIIIIITNDHV